jgi:hypothetical protein
MLAGAAPVPLAGGGDLTAGAVRAPWSDGRAVVALAVLGRRASGREWREGELSRRPRRQGTEESLS